MKKKYLMIISLLGVVFFSGCGSGSQSNSEKIDLKSCNEFTNVLVGDIIIHDTNNTLIKTTFDTNGSKKVCIVSGAAHILR